MSQKGTERQENQEKKLSSVVSKEAELVNNPASANELLREMQEEITPEATPLWLFVNNHAPKIAAIVVLFVVVIGGYAFFQGYQEGKLADSRQELSLIISIQNDDGREQALEKFKVDMPQELATAVNLELANIAINKKDFAKAERLFALVAEENKGLALGFVASLNRGDTMVRQGHNKEAYAFFEGLVSGAKEEMLPILYLRMAETAELAKMNKEAIEAYKSILKVVPEGTDITFYNARIADLS